MQEEINNYKNIYKSIGSTYCPYLRQEVKFNSPGWNHLLRKRDSMRSTKDVLERAKYLKESSEIISISHTLQEYEERIINKKVNKFYGFIAIVENQKLKIDLLHIPTTPNCKTQLLS